MSRRLILLPLFLLALGPLGAADKDTWTEVRSPNFTVISSVGDKHGRNIADQFETFRAVFAQLFPKIRVDLGKPLIILAVRNEKELKQLIPAYWEKKGNVHPAGLFVPGQEKLYVALRTDTEGEYPFSVIYHEYVHALMNLNVDNLPAWLNEGLAEFYAQAYFTNKEITLGRPSEYHLIYLNQQKLLPLEALLSAGHDSPYYNESNKASVFYAQSWALTHFLLFDKTSRENQWLVKYLTKTANGQPPMEAAEQVFGDLKLFARKFDNYIRQQVFLAIKAKPDTVIDEKTFPARALNEAEAAALVGDFHVHTNRPVEAKAALERALALDPKSALAHESFGVYYLRQQNWEEAARWFEKAVQLDSKSFLAYYHAAVLVVQRGGMADESETAASRLRRAIELNPAFAPAYSTLAGLYTAQDEKLEEALTLARRAASLEPGVLLHRLNIAQVLLRMKKIDEAIAIGQRIVAVAKEPGERAMGETFVHTAQQYRESLARFEAAKKAEEEAVGRRAADRAEYAAAMEKRAEEEVERRAAAQLKPGELAAYGTITEVTCTGPETLQIRVSAGSGSLSLRAAKRNAVDYVIGLGRPLRFDPCQHLRGQQAQVIYRPAKLRTQPGELARVEMLENPVVAGNQPTPPPLPTEQNRSIAQAKDGAAEKPAPLPSGPAGFSEGKITALTCMGAELRITVDLGGGFSSKLRSGNYHRIEFFAAPGVTIPDNFQPCVILRGRNVAIKYAGTGSAGLDGEILTIEIRP